MKPERLRQHLRYLRASIFYLEDLSQEKAKPYWDALICCGQNGLAGKVIHFEGIGYERGFLEELAQAIDQFLSQSEIAEFSASIPENLKEMVEQYNQRLEKDYQKYLGNLRHQGENQPL